ncbi:MAG: hypothetical protein J0G33_02810 [Afipia felis]|nr:hypothetical protein [Afipia felis]
MSERHFGIPQTTARPVTGGRQPTARHHAPPEAQRNPQSLAAYPSLPRSPFTQAMLDALAVISLILLGSAFGFALAFAVFVFLIVWT